MARSASGKDNVAYPDLNDLVKNSRRQSKLFKTNLRRSIIPGSFNDESEVQDDDEDDDEEGGPSRTKDLLIDATKIVNEDQLQSFAATETAKLWQYLLTLGNTI
ncbi:MAG: hypothetical protein Q9171_007181 [Xanthocarpia ochracea]